jgi:CheY-like chemotaxis protein
MRGEGPRTVLVVADSSDALTAAEGLAGAYRVETARSADEALAVLGVGDGAGHDVDVLVTAAYLPDRSGETLLETLREHGVRVRAGVLVPPTAGAFPTFDVRVDRPVTAAALSRAVDRLVSLEEYDTRVDRLYELARRQGRRDDAAPPVGDGGFDAVDGTVLAARAAADAALTDVRTEDRDRLFVGEPTRTAAGTEDDSR